MNSFATLVIVCWLSAAGTPEPELAPRDGVLVLDNGGVLSGRVTRAGDYYLVTVGSRSEVRVPVRDVDLYCDSLEEAYRQLRARVDPEDLAGRLDLADWCLRQGLTGAAADELLEVMARQPGHIRLPGLVRRLNTAIEPPRQRAAAQTPSERPLGVDQLERFARGLPAATVEQFTTQVQPLLFNRCGGSGCHGGHSSSDFRLIRPSGAAAISRRFTQRNLHSVLQQVDSEAPEFSPLLRQASAPHGGRQTAMLGSREKEQFELLAAWVRRAVRPESEERKETDPFTVNSPAAREVRPAYAELPVEDSARYVQPAQYLEPGEARRLPTADGQPQFVPRDPFDPEIFNRRYRNSQNARQKVGGIKEAERPAAAEELPRDEPATPLVAPIELPVEHRTFPPPATP